MEINMTGSYYNSDRFVPGNLYEPRAGENWLLKAPSPVLGFTFSNAGGNAGGDDDTNWTFKFA
jgi:hypothetical protein